MGMVAFYAGLIIGFLMGFLVLALLTHVFGDSGLSELPVSSEVGEPNFKS